MSILLSGNINLYLWFPQTMFVTDFDTPLLLYASPPPLSPLLCRSIGWRWIWLSFTNPLFGFRLWNYSGFLIYSFLLSTVISLQSIQVPHFWNSIYARLLCNYPTASYSILKARNYANKNSKRFAVSFFGMWGIKDLHLMRVCVGHNLQVTEHRHLKYYVSMAGPDLLCVSSSKESQEILKRIEREATFTYQTLTLSEEAAANVLYINGTLIHRTMSEIPASCQVLAEKIDIPRQMLNITELGKLGTGLSSCCLLLRRSKYLR